MADDVLVIGAGVAGMKASLLLASAGRQVHLIEKFSVIGGRIIHSEDVFPAMECATCLVSPMQQDVLRNDLINIVTLGDVLSVNGSKGSFRVSIRKRASSVDPIACIGCAECWNACPVEINNDFEENLSIRKAISVPCAGALPNVPWIDRDHCLRWNGKQNCSICSEACVFGAVNYSEQDSEFEITVSDIIVTTGFQPPEGDVYKSFGWGVCPGVFTASEFERYYASNGPTAGELITKEGLKPESAAILVHAGGIESSSSINTMYSLKFIHYLKEKLPQIRPLVFIDASYSPDALEDRYHRKWPNTAADVVLYTGIPEVSGINENNGITITCDTAAGSFMAETDLLVLGTSMLPSSGTSQIIEMLGINSDDDGFARTLEAEFSAVTSAIPGIYIAGCAGGPLSISASVTEASAAVGRVLADIDRGGR